MSALQRGQPLAAVPGGARRAARRPLRRSLKHHVAATEVAVTPVGALPDSKIDVG
jgi:hypothetical protein